MRTSIIFLLALIPFLSHSQHQDYPIFMDNFWNGIDSTKIEATNELLSTATGMEYVVRYESTVNELSTIQHEYEISNDSLLIAFVDNNTNPETTILHKEIDTLLRELKTLRSHYNGISIIFAVTENEYNVCAYENPETHIKDCDEIKKRYIKAAKDINNIIDDHETKRYSLIYKNRMYNEMVETYNNNIDQLEQQKASLLFETQEKLNQTSEYLLSLTDEIIAHMSNIGIL